MSSLRKEKHSLSMCAAHAKENHVCRPTKKLLGIQGTAASGSNVTPVLQSAQYRPFCNKARDTYCTAKDWKLIISGATRNKHSENQKW
eukprot:1159539-Pelagomonas_calceolata.AAC.9